MGIYDEIKRLETELAQPFALEQEEPRPAHGGVNVLAEIDRLERELEPEKKTAPQKTGKDFSVGDWDEVYRRIGNDKIREENLENMGDFRRGLNQGAQNVQAGLYGMAGLVGSGHGNEALKNWGFEGYKRNTEEASLYPTKALDDIDGVGSFVDYVQGFAGSLTPTVIEAGAGSLLGGGMGYAGMKWAAKKAAKEAVESQLKKGIIKQTEKAAVRKQLENQALKQSLKPVMNKAAKAGMFSAVSAMESGLNYGELLEKHGIDAPFSSLAFGSAAASLDLLGGNIRLIDNFVSGVASKAPGNYLKRTAREILINTPAEGLQEAGQEAFSILNIVANTNEKLLTPENMKRIFESGVAGSIAGMGGAPLKAFRKSTLSDVDPEKLLSDDALEAETENQKADEALEADGIKAPADVPDEIQTQEQLDAILDPPLFKRNIPFNPPDLRGQDTVNTEDGRVKVRQPSRPFNLPDTTPRTESDPRINPVKSPKIYGESEGMDEESLVDVSQPSKPLGPYPYGEGEQAADRFMERQESHLPQDPALIEGGEQTDPRIVRSAPQDQGGVVVAGTEYGQRPDRAAVADNLEERQDKTRHLMKNLPKSKDKLEQALSEETRWTEERRGIERQQNLKKAQGLRTQIQDILKKKRLTKKDRKLVDQLAGEIETLGSFDFSAEERKVNDAKINAALSDAEQVDRQGGVDAKNLENPIPSQSKKMAEKQVVEKDEVKNLTSSQESLPEANQSMTLAEAKQELGILKRYPNLSDNPKKEIADLERVVADLEKNNTPSASDTSAPQGVASNKVSLPTFKDKYNYGRESSKNLNAWLNKNVKEGFSTVDTGDNKTFGYYNNKVVIPLKDGRATYVEWSDDDTTATVKEVDPKLVEPVDDKPYHPHARSKSNIAGDFSGSIRGGMVASSSTDSNSKTNGQKSKPENPPQASESRSNRGGTSKAKPIEDFGEKIEGARKDYASRMTQAKDLDSSKNPLSKTFPEPKYQELLDRGVDPYVVGAVRAARDEIPNKPRKAWALKQWAKKLEGLRDFADSMINGKITKEQFVEGIKKDHKSLLGPIHGRAELYEIFGHDASLKGVRFEKNFWSVYKGEKNVTKWQILKEGSKSAFSNMPRILGEGNTKKEAIADFKKKYESFKNEGKGPKKVNFQIYQYRANPGTHWIGKKVGRNYIDLKSFESSAEAREYLNENYDSLVKDLERHKYIPDTRRQSNEERIGEDHRQGKDVTKEMFTDAFGFRGVQFGRYVGKTHERQNALNNAYDALMDLAGILNIPTQAISLNGELGLAFGARGKGGKNAAAAHYEPGQVVINLTKKQGAGSLAHEWWHSLDNYFSRLRGQPSKHLSEHPYRRTTNSADEIRQEVIDAFKDIEKAYTETGIQKRSAKLDAKRTKAYWGTKPEITARIFEQYVINKLDEKGGLNDYLANIAGKDEFLNDLISNMGDPNFEAEGYYPYLNESEIDGVEKAFDKFFKAIKTKKTDKGIALYSIGQDRGFQKSKSGKLIGYKVMAVDESGRLVSGANSRLKFKNSPGEQIKMPGDGVFLSNKPQYVMDYYSGLADNEVLLKVEFDPSDIAFGESQLNDREPEIGVRQVKILDSMDAEDFSGKFQADQAPGQGITLSDIQKQYPNQEITTNPDGSISVRFKNGKGVRIKTVEHIGGDDYRFAVESGRMRKNGAILGKYQDGEITLNKNLADVETAIHENLHMLKDLGILNKMDMAVLNRHHNQLVKQGKYRYDVLKDQEENQANTLAQMISDREAYRGKSSLHRVIQKVVDFFDGLVNIGRQSARKLAREYESGEIYSREANGKSKQSIPNLSVSSDRTLPQDAPLTDQDYIDNRKQQGNIKLKAASTVARIKREVSKGTDKFLGSVSTRLKMVSPKLSAKVRTLDFDINTKAAEDLKTALPLLKKAKRMTKKDMLDWDFARKNSDSKKLKELSKKYGIEKEYQAVRTMLDRIREEAIDVGYDVGEIKDYWPRVLKDQEGFLKAIGKGPERPEFTDILKKKAKDMGIEVSEMDDSMKADIISNMILGKYYGIPGPGGVKQRVFEKIPKGFNQFYMDSDAALMQHIHSMRKRIEARRFFGKVPDRIAAAKTRLRSAETRLRKLEGTGQKDKINDLKTRIGEYRAIIEKYKHQNDFEENIGAYVVELLATGEIAPTAENTVKEILTARFNEHGTRGLVNAYKNLSYIDTMGSPISAITQIGDLAWAAYEGGMIPALKHAYKAARGKSKITKEDVGVERIAQEFADADTLSRAVSKVFRYVGLETMDSIGKESLLNTAYEKYQKAAKQNPAKLKKEIRPIFGKETDTVIDDLLGGEVSDNVKLLVYHRLLDFQPVALSEMPEKYLTAGNGRIFYMLKTFTLKQFDVFRKEVYVKLRKGDRAEKIQAMKNFASLASLFVLANAGADELKDYLLGRDTDFEDRVVDNTLRLFGVSKFVTWKARTEGAGSSMARQILPPFKFIDAATKDITSAGDGKGLHTVASIPIAGKLAYWHMGRGQHNRGDRWDRNWLKEKRRLNKIKGRFERSDNKGQFTRKYRKELVALKRVNKIQGQLNKYKKEINLLKAKPQTETVERRIANLEKRRTNLIRRYFGRARGEK